MITITKGKTIPPFSSIEGDAHSPVVKLTRIGEMVVVGLKELTERYIEMVVYCHSIMPDHIHFVVEVIKPTSYHLGTAIGWMKGVISRCVWELGIAENESIFNKNFHDRILTSAGQLDIMKRYVADNPLRYIIKRDHPDLFCRKNSVKIDGIDYDAIGNIFLLRNTLISQVRLSRKYTSEQVDALERHWVRVIEEGGVLVSPFISQREKVFRDIAIDGGANVIIIEQNGFGKRYKPSGRYFNLCAEGRLLIIAPIGHSNSRMALTRVNALRMNNIALIIANGQFELSVSVMR